MINSLKKKKIKRKIKKKKSKIILMKSKVNCLELNKKKLKNK